jgi:hypothetical protein
MIYGLSAALLIATTLKNAKGESVCSRTNSTLAPLGSRVFCLASLPRRLMREVLI